MKFGRCQEHRSKSPAPRKGHRSAKLPSQEPPQTSALLSTSSTPGETPRQPPPPPATVKPILLAWWEQHALPALQARRGFLRPSGMDGGLLRPLSGDQMSPAGPLPPAGTLAGSWELLHCRWSGRGLRRSPAHLPPSLVDFACGWAKSPPSFPVDEAGDGNGDRDGAEPVVGRHHLGPAR